MFKGRLSDLIIDMARANKGLGDTTVAIVEGFETMIVQRKGEEKKTVILRVKFSNEKDIVQYEVKRICDEDSISICLLESQYIFSDDEYNKIYVSDEKAFWVGYITYRNFQKTFVIRDNKTVFLDDREIGRITRIRDVIYFISNKNIEYYIKKDKDYRLELIDAVRTNLDLLENEIREELQKNECGKFVWEIN